MANKQTIKSLIIGFGQIGQALYQVLSPYYHVSYIAKKETREGTNETFDVIHICFPYSGEFEKEVKRYQKVFKPKYTVIHSTVPVGATRGLGAIHSPIIGIHPYLKESVKMFVKYLGGDKKGEMADYFRKAGLRVYLFDKPETTELMKLLDTLKYSIDIEYTKEVKRLCDIYKVPFEAWTIYTDNYNKGYSMMGYPEYIRPNLIPIMKKIGGHCLIPNLDLLKSKFSDFIKKLNK